MSPQAPIKASPETRERLRFLAPLLGTTQSDIVDRAVQEFAVRHADVINKGIDHARSVLAAGDSAIAAHLLDVSVVDVDRISGSAG
jgi:predicted transcriptional regulator